MLIKTVCMVTCGYMPITDVAFAQCIMIFSNARSLHLVEQACSMAGHTKSYGI